LRFRLEVEPRAALIAPIVKIQLGRFADRIEHELREVDRVVQAGGSACFHTSVSPTDEIALARAALALSHALPAERAELGVRLCRWLREATDSDAVRIRPFELADQFNADPRETLAVCLTAVKSGLLVLSWELICPSCRTASDQVEALSDLPVAGHCQLCDLSFDLELDRAVEATFRPAPALRTLDTGPYCIGGPRRTPHVIAQEILPANGGVTLRAPVEPGRYRIFVRGGISAAVEVTAAEGSQELEFTVTESALIPGAARAAPNASIVVVQSGARERHVKLERMLYASRAATAHVVSTLPEFRREFSGDLLRPGTTLRVARVALLFTDLTDSTALYSRVGDARAFRVVHDHFELLIELIAKHRGTLVKTIGDAVMAAFIEERDAVHAAREMLERFPSFRSGLPEAQRTFLKVGVYAGPCYIVTANGILDYFGQTVNLAARLQGAARAGELVLVEQLANEAHEHGWLGDHCASECFEASLKGLDGPVRVARVLVDRP
jgi:class 3 adenylate cyclase